MIQIKEINKRLFGSQRKKCFICDKPIDLELQDCEIDHIIPRAKGGKDEDLCGVMKIEEDELIWKY